MNKQKRVMAVIIFALAAIFAAAGIIQLVLYIPAELAMLATAKAQGATAQQISGFYSQNLIPAIFNYFIQSFGIASILVACGLIYVKPANAAVSVSDVKDTTTQVASVQDENESSDNNKKSDLQNPVEGDKEEI